MSAALTTRPFADMNKTVKPVLAASVHVARQKLIETAMKTTRKKTRRKSATTKNTEGLRESITKILDLSDLDVSTKITVIRAMLA